jgi:hypothetical protein
MISAWFRIAVVDLIMALRRFSALHRFVARIPVRRRRDPETVENIVRTVDRAAIYYPRELLCLRRSAAITWMLRQYGHPAELVVGARIIPFGAHAWVELHGRVVNDDENEVRARYTVLERSPVPAES